MRSLGVDARIAVDARHAESMNRFYADVLEPDSLTVFASDAELLTTAEGFDVIVATLWSTPALIGPIAERWPGKAYVYYVQDYEPWFFPQRPGIARNRIGILYASAEHGINGQDRLDLSNGSRTSRRRGLPGHGQP